jgi:hypothetical protein
MLLESGEKSPARDTIYTICFFFARENTWYGGSGSFFSKLYILVVEECCSYDGESGGLP